mgnify:CR=1 FL=1
MEKSKPVVVGIGELLWDVFPDVKKAGGAPINFVYHATQLGAEGYAISAVGNDVFGTEIIQELDKNGIDSNRAKERHPFLYDHRRCGMGSYPAYPSVYRPDETCGRRMLRNIGATCCGIS